MTALVRVLIAAGLAAPAEGPGKDPAPPPAVEHALAQYAELTSPGDGHRQLDVLRGRWKVEAAWGAPGQAATRLTGVSDNSWKVGGRFLQCLFTAGEGKDQVEAMTMLGYDRVSHAYFLATFGTLGTHYVHLDGAYYAMSRSFVFRGESMDPATRQLLRYRVVLVADSAERHVIEVFFEAPGRDPLKLWQATYTRMTDDAAAAPR